MNYDDHKIAHCLPNGAIITVPSCASWSSECEQHLWGPEYERKSPRVTHPDTRQSSEVFVSAPGSAGCGRQGAGSPGAGGAGRPARIPPEGGAHSVSRGGCVHFTAELCSCPPPGPPFSSLALGSLLLLKDPLPPVLFHPPNLPVLKVKTQPGRLLCTHPPFSDAQAPSSVPSTCPHLTPRLQSLLLPATSTGKSGRRFPQPEPVPHSLRSSPPHAPHTRQAARPRACVSAEPASPPPSPRRSCCMACP